MYIAKLFMTNPGTSGSDGTRGNSVVDPGLGIADFAAALAEHQRAQAMVSMPGLDAFSAHRTSSSALEASSSASSPREQSVSRPVENLESPVERPTDDNLADGDERMATSDPERDAMASAQVASATQRAETRESGTKASSSENPEADATQNGENAPAKGVEKAQATQNGENSQASSNGQVVSSPGAAPMQAADTDANDTVTPTPATTVDQAPQKTTGDGPQKAASQTTATTAVAVLKAAAVAGNNSPAQSSSDPALSAQQVQQTSRAALSANAAAVVASVAAKAAAGEAGEVSKASGQTLQASPPGVGVSLAQNVSNDVDLNVPSSQPAVETGKVSLAALPDRVIRAVRLMVSNGEKTVTVRLIPESLGELHLEVRSTAESLHVKLISPHSAVREVLGSQLQSLRDALTQDGLDVTGIVVSGDSTSGFLASQHSGSQGAASDALAASGDGSRFRAQSNGQTDDSRTTLYTRVTHEGAIDLLV